MKQFIYLSAVAGLLAVSLSGCMDKDYDLSDIDTTSEIKLVDLVLPVNVSTVRLDDIIKLDANSSLTTVSIDGKEAYAVLKTGTFESQSLQIKDIEPTVPEITEAQAHFKLVNVSGSHTFHLQPVDPQALSYTADNVDDYIVSLSKIFMEDEPSVLTMVFSLQGGASAGVTYDLSDLVIDLPAGLNIIDLPEGYKYTPDSGLLTIDHLPCPNGIGSISLTVNGMKMTDETKFVGQKLEYNSSITFKDAVLTVNSTGTSTVPEDMFFTIDSSLSALHITAFSGRVHYNLDSENMKIAPVDLSDLPDFLAQKDTRILLANPQIYIGVDNNPVAEYGLSFDTGLRLSKVYGTTQTPYEPEKRIKTNSDFGAGPYNFVLSPTDPKTYPAEFTKNIVHDPFPGMSKILYGAGLPDQIAIDLLTPMIPEDDVTHFVLKEYPALTGSYEFLAPLAFKPANGEEQTVIEYSDTRDDWGSDDLDKLTIRELTLDADAISTMPLNAELRVVPIAEVAEDLQVSDVKLEGKPGVQHVTMTVTGNIQKFKGVKISATVRPSGEAAIAPNQTITLTNLKARVTGSYVTDF